MRLFLKKRVEIDFAEIHGYVRDLQHVTDLRNKSPIDSEERRRYDDMLKVMQLVMIQLNDIREK